MIYTTFKQWVKGRFFASKDELALIETGWNYGYDAGVQWQKTQQALDKIADNERELNIQMQPEPVAFLHEVVASDGEPDQALSFSPDNFPLQGVGGFKSVSVKSLVLANDTSQDRIDETAKQRTWVGLMDEEIVAICQSVFGIDPILDGNLRKYAKAFEAKLKQKNGYAEEKNT